MSTISINVVEEFGAKGDNITDNSPAIEAALTELKKRLDTQPSRIVQGELFFPHSNLPYRISRPIILDRAYVGIVGENKTVTIENSLSFEGPTVLMGVRSKELNSKNVLVQASSNYRPDVFGELDSSITNAPNQRWGFRTNNNATAIFNGTAGDLGPSVQGSYNRAYNNVSSGFVLDLAIKHASGTPFYGGTTAGIVNIGNGPDTVFSLNRGGATNQFDYYMCFTDGTYIQTSINPGATTSGLFKIAIQVDVINRGIQAYFNGKQIAIGSGGTFFKGSGATTVIDNKYYAMVIGTNTNYTDTYQTLAGTYNQVGIDFSLFGMSLSNGLLYKNNGVGQPQQRLDNGLLNDSYRYYWGDHTNKNRFFYLNLINNPSAEKTNRFLSAYTHSAPGVSNGLIIENSMYTKYGGILGNYMKNITINGTPLNPTISIGKVLEPYFENVVFGKGTIGFNVLNLGASYTLRMNDCQFEGYNHSMRLSMATVEVDNATFGSIGKSAIKTIGCNLNLDKAFVAFGSDSTNCFYESYGYYYGGNNSIRNITIDFEGNTFKQGVFYLEQHPLFIAPATCYEIKSVYCGTVGTGHVINAVQKYPYDGVNYLMLNVDNIQVSDTQYKSFLNINGNSIIGTVKNISPDVGCAMTHTGQFTNECNVQIEHRGYKLLPRQKQWKENGHIFFAQSPKESQFSEYRCVKTGTIGTDNPPKFVGINPLISKSNSMAVYGYSQAYTKVPVSRTGIPINPPNNI